MATSGVDMRRTSAKIYLIVPLAIFVLFIVLLLVWRFTRRKKAATTLLPLTLTPQPPREELTFVQRHIDALRAWRKPSIPVDPSNSSRLTQTSSAVELLHIPTLRAPPAAAQPGRKKMDYKEFIQRQRRRDPNADENHRHVRESWVPIAPRREHWRRVGEEMEARKTPWEKAKDKIGL
ncbi:hypothetical protein ACN47E_003443 [Coniothyrium glycines]